MSFLNSCCENTSAANDTDAFEAPTLHVIFFTCFANYLNLHCVGIASFNELLRDFDVKEWHLSCHLFWLLSGLASWNLKFLFLQCLIDQLTVVFLCWLRPICITVNQLTLLGEAILDKRRVIIIDGTVSVIDIVNADVDFVPPRGDVLCDCPTI